MADPIYNLPETVDRLNTATDMVVAFVKGDDTLDIVGDAGTYPSLAKLTRETKEDLNNLQSIPFANASTDDLYLGMPVYSVSEVAADIASASSSTKKNVLGLVTEDRVLSQGGHGHAKSTGMLTGTVEQWERATGMVGGLLPMTDYFLDVVAGRITPFPPSGPGQYLCPVGRALSSTDFLVRIDKTVAI